MEVTSLNFEQLLPQIKKTVENAAFLAIDCEFSGLNSVSDINIYDSPQLYYEKVRKNSMDFLVVQYGLSAFRFDVDSKQFKQQTYNFYIFRRPVKRNIPDQRFLCQASSIDFLMSQGFDFNKLFKFGIPYLNNSEEDTYRATLEENHLKKIQPQQNSGAISSGTQVPEEQKQLVDDIFKAMEDFLEGDPDGEALELTQSNPFTRKLVYEAFKSKPYKTKLNVETKAVSGDTKARILVITRKKSPEEEAEICRKEHEEQLSVMDNFIGFSKVLKMVVASGKPIVGHNMCLDFLHTIDKFLTPLPETYEDFKHTALSLFSSVIDTKYMSSSGELRESLSYTSTVLKDLLDTCSKNPFHIPVVEVEEGGQGYSLNDGKEHEAGYDAYITGLCFLSMWNHVGKSRGLSAKDTFKDMSLIQPFVNRLYVFLKDMNYINLGGADPDPPRDHVFYIKFPKEWTQTNIVELFNPYGGGQISWIDDCSAYVSLYKRENANTALKEFTTKVNKSSRATVISHKMRQDELSATTWPVYTNRRKRGPSTSEAPNKKMRTDKNTKKQNYSCTTTVNEDEESEDELRKKSKETNAARRHNKNRANRSQGTKPPHSIKPVFQTNDDWN